MSMTCHLNIPSQHTICLLVHCPARQISLFRLRLSLPHHITDLVGPLLVRARPANEGRRPSVVVLAEMSVSCRPPIQTRDSLWGTCSGFASRTVAGGCQTCTLRGSMHNDPWIWNNPTTFTFVRSTVHQLALYPGKALTVASCYLMVVDGPKAA